MVTGSCLCRAVTFEIDEFRGGIFKCHCSKCRKAFGGASSAAALCKTDQFRWLTGEDTINVYRESESFQRHFCTQCGGIVPQHLPDMGLCWVPAGLLDGDPGLTLNQHIHVDSKAAWEQLDEDTPCLAGGFNL